SAVLRLEQADLPLLVRELRWAALAARLQNCDAWTAAHITHALHQRLEHDAEVQGPNIESEEQHDAFRAGAYELVRNAPVVVRDEAEKLEIVVLRQDVVGRSCAEQVKYERRLPVALHVLVVARLTRLAPSAFHLQWRAPDHAQRNAHEGVVVRGHERR